jgi:hypothetical protein
MAKKDKLIEGAKTQLESDEVIQEYVIGAFKTKRLGADSARVGVLIATDRKVLFYGKKTFGFETEVFPYSNISSIELSKGMLGHKIILFASGNKAEMGSINSPNVNEFLKVVRGNLGKKKEGSVIAASSADELKKFAELRDAGIISEDEFIAKKKQLLGI